MKKKKKKKEIMINYIIWYIRVKKCVFLALEKYLNLLINMIIINPIPRDIYIVKLLQYL